MLTTEKRCRFNNYFLWQRLFENNLYLWILFIYLNISLSRLLEKHGLAVVTPATFEGVNSLWLHHFEIQKLVHLLWNTPLNSSHFQPEQRERAVQELLSVFCLQLFSVFRVSRWKTERSNGMIQQRSAPVGTHSARHSANKTPAGAPQRRRPTWTLREGVGRMQMQLLDGEKEGGEVSWRWVDPSRSTSCSRLLCLLWAYLHRNRNYSYGCNQNIIS